MQGPKPENLAQSKNEWREMHYSGEEADKDKRIEKILYEWKKAVDVKEYHLVNVIRRVISSKDGLPLLFYTSRNRRAIYERKDSGTIDVPKPLVMFLKYCEAQVKKPYTQDLIIRCVIESDEYDPKEKECLIALFQIERVRRIRSGAHLNNDNLEIAESILKAAISRFKKNVPNVIGEVDIKDGRYFIPIQVLPTFMKLQEGLCAYRKSNHELTLRYVTSGLEELKKCEDFYAQHLIKWWFKYIQFRVYEGTYLHKKAFEIAKEQQTILHDHMDDKMRSYISKVSTISEKSQSQETYRLLEEYHTGLHLYIYCGPLEKEKVSGRIKIILDDENVVKYAPKDQNIRQLLGYKKSHSWLNEKLVRATFGFSEGHYVTKDGSSKIETHLPLPSHYKIPGLYTRVDNLKFSEYKNENTLLSRINNMLVFTELQLMAIQERKHHLTSNIITLTMIDFFAKCRMTIHELVRIKRSWASEVGRTEPIVEEDKKRRGKETLRAKEKKQTERQNELDRIEPTVKKRIEQLVNLALNIINDNEWSENKNSPSVIWLSGIAEILRIIELKNRNLDSVCGSFIGFEYIGFKEEKPPRLFRANSTRKLNILRDKLKKDKNKELSIEDIASEIGLDYNFVIWLLHENRNDDELKKYLEDSKIKETIDKWEKDKPMTKFILQLCIPKLDKQTKEFIKFSATPLSLFQTEMKDGKLEFKTYRGIVGERNITK